MAAVNGANGSHANGAVAQAGAGKKGPKIAIIGAGVNGIASAVFLKDYAHHDNFVILDRASDFGGTWWNIRYPGLSCDIPATLYQFQFAPKPDWSSPYPFREELIEYILKVAKDYDLYRFAQFNTSVQTMTWDESTSEWILKLGRYKSEEDLEFTDDEMRVNIILDLHKPTNEPGFPGIEGAGWNKDHYYYKRNPAVQPLGAFEGHVMHSMVYDLDYDLSDKRVALIGCAASGMQITQTIGPKCKHLYVYHRTPEWILPRFDDPFTEEQKKFWAENPLEYAIYRGNFNREFFDLWWGAMKSSKSPQSKKTIEMCLENMHKSIKDEKLRKVLTPTFPPWSRRVLVSSKFYPTLMRENVTLCHERILKITKNAVVSSSEDPVMSAVPAGAPVPPPDPNAEIFEREVDVIIYATGWSQGPESFKRMVPMFGKGGVNMLQQFGEAGEPYNYMGAQVDNFPNYFMVAGAGALPADTFQRAGEIVLNYFLPLLDRIKRENIASFEVKREACKRWDAMIQKLASHEDFAMLTPGVKSYYKAYRRDGTYKLFGFCPTTDDAMQVVFRNILWDDYILTPRKEPW